jgi:hypothetical protein
MEGVSAPNIGCGGFETKYFLQILTSKLIKVTFRSPFTISHPPKKKIRAINTNNVDSRGFENTQF